MIKSDPVARLVEQWLGVLPEIDPRPLEVVQRVIRAGQFAWNRLNDVAQSHGLAVRGDFDVLSTLVRNAPVQLTPADVADELLLTRAGITGRLDRLEGLGLVERLPDRFDRRSIRLKLTAAGSRLVKQVFAANLAAQQAMVEDLNDDEAVTLAGLLERVLFTMGDRETAPRR